MSTATVPPTIRPNFGPQLDEPTPDLGHISLAARTPPPNPALPPDGWSARDKFGPGPTYQMLTVRRLGGEDAHLDLRLLHHGRDLEQAINARQTEAVNALGAEVRQQLAETEEGKAFAGIAQELAGHEATARTAGATISKLTAERSAEVTLGRPGLAARLAKLDEELSAVRGILAHATRDAELVRPALEPKRRAVEGRAQQIADLASSQLFEQLTAERAAVVKALLLKVPKELTALVATDQARLQVMGHRMTAIASAMSALSMPVKEPAK